MAGKGLSVKELLNGTPIGRRLDAALVHITKFAKGVSAKSGFPGVSAKTGAGRVVYDTQIIGTAHGIPLMKQQAVRVSCSCPDYMFNFEYANAHHQAGIVRYGNGDPPLNTNPSLTPGLCVAVGTLITTRDFGCIPIEEIKPGTVVLTYMGYFPVLDARLTGRDVQCVTVTSETDRSVNLTPTHPMMSHYASETSGAQAGGDVKFDWEKACDLGTDHSLLVSLVSSEREEMDRPDSDDVKIITLVSEKVAGITNGPVCDVYNLTVDIAESYVAGGFVVKNCKHLVALAQEAARKKL
jgi:hypothetical protein